MEKIVIDLDNTLCSTKDGNYKDSVPKANVIKMLQKYQELGFSICIHTSRNMRTYAGNIGMINANTLPIIITWLKKYNIPYDEIVIGKPWCGENGFYIDDRAIRPSEFVELSQEEILNLIKEEQCY